jgi:glycogen operon protein
MTDDEWQNDFASCLGLFLAGDALEEQDEKGQPILDDNFLLLVNGHYEPISFTIPDMVKVKSWRIMLDTAKPDGKGKGKYIWAAKDSYPLLEHSLVLLRESAGRETDCHDD